MGDDYQNKIAKLKGQIKSYPDFPKPGILFWLEYHINYK